MNEWNEAADLSPMSPSTSEQQLINPRHDTDSQSGSSSINQGIISDKEFHDDVKSSDSTVHPDHAHLNESSKDTGSSNHQHHHQNHHDTLHPPMQATTSSPSSSTSPSASPSVKAQRVALTLPHNSPVMCPSSPMLHTHDDTCITDESKHFYELSLDAYHDDDTDTDDDYTAAASSTLTGSGVEQNTENKKSKDDNDTDSVDYMYTGDDEDDDDDITHITLSEHTSPRPPQLHYTNDLDYKTMVGVVLCGRDKTITHINDAFTRITGYTADDVLGKPSLSLLQGQETSTEAISAIRDAIQSESSCKVCLINYRKDRTPFWNLLTIVPMINSTTGQVDAWIGIQRLHQPKPYVDRLMKMFPWTTHIPQQQHHNTMNAKKQQRYYRYYKRLNASQNQNPQHHRQLGSSVNSSNRPLLRNRDAAPLHQSSQKALLPHSTISSHRTTTSEAIRERLQRTGVADDMIDNAHHVPQHDADDANRNIRDDANTQPHPAEHTSASASSAATISPSSHPLSLPKFYRYSSVDEQTDGEQDIDYLLDTDDDTADNRYSAHPTPVSFISETSLPTHRGVYRVRAYKDLAKVDAAAGHAHLLGSESEIICIIAGKIENSSNVPVRVHDACFTSEVLGSLKCDCKEQLDWSMDYIYQRSLKAANAKEKNVLPSDTQMNGHHASTSHVYDSSNSSSDGHQDHDNNNDRKTNNSSNNGAHENKNRNMNSSGKVSNGQYAGGMIIYMPQEGRGIGLANKLKAYSLQTGLGLDTVDANRALGFPDDLRSYNVVPAILDDMNIKSIKLMTNNPRKVEVLERLGIEVTGCIPVIVQPNSTYAAHYLHTKANRMEHNIILP